jgi:hypothetical protein
LHSAIRHDRQDATSTIPAEFVFGGAGRRPRPAPDSALIIQADGVPLDADADELLHRSVDVLVLKHPD